MKIDEKIIDKEIEQWKKFYNNYENLAIQILADVFAHYNKEDRDALIKHIEETISSIESPINGQLMYESIKSDIESFDRINNEAKIAYRTLQWIKDSGESTK